LVNSYNQQNQIAKQPTKEEEEEEEEECIEQPTSLRLVIFHVDNTYALPVVMPARKRLAYLIFSVFFSVQQT
jgi:hypothetical protein